MATAVDLSVGHDTPDSAWTIFINLDSTDDGQEEQSFDDLRRENFVDPPLLKEINDIPAQVRRSEHEAGNANEIAGLSRLQWGMNRPAEAGQPLNSVCSEAHSANPTWVSSPSDKGYMKAC